MTIESELEERLFTLRHSLVDTDRGMIERSQEAKRLLRAELVKGLEYVISDDNLRPTYDKFHALARLAIFESMVK